MPFPSPSAFVPDLNDWQFYYNGVYMGEGTPYATLSITGLSASTIRSGDTGRELDQGEFMGIDLYGGRDVTISLWVGASGGESLQSLLSTLSGAFTVAGTTSTPFYFQLPSLPLLCVMLRPRKYATPIDLDYGAASVGKPQASLHGVDPRVYVAPTTASVVDLSPPVGGLTFPITFPVSFGGGAYGEIDLDNSGDFEMRPVLTITGPCTNPTVANDTITGGPVLTFSNPAQTSFTLNSGDTLAIDLDFQSVIYTPDGGDTGSYVPGWVVPGSTWWNLIPGVNEIQFGSSDAGMVAGFLTVDWTPAYSAAT